MDQKESNGPELLLGGAPRGAQYGITLGFMEVDAQAVFPLSTSEG